jgi:hypothetical protein
VLLNDEKPTMQQFNKLCGNENLFSYTQVPRRKNHVDVTPGGVVLTPKAARDWAGVTGTLQLGLKFLHIS